MFRMLRGVILRLLGRRPPTSGPSHDPYAGVRQPRKRGPTGRDSAVAVMEPESGEVVRAVGRSRFDRNL
jgi:hypothetical protein